MQNLWRISLLFLILTISSCSEKVKAPGEDKPSSAEGNNNPQTGTSNQQSAETQGSSTTRPLEVKTTWSKTLKESYAYMAPKPVGNGIVFYRYHRDGGCIIKKQGRKFIKALKLAVEEQRANLHSIKAMLPKLKSTPYT